MKTIFIFLSSLILLLSSMIPVCATEVTVEQGVSAEVVTEYGADISGSKRVAEAKSLFEGRCQMCHQLPEPSMLRPEQWKLILTTMQQRMQQAGVPPLTQEETDRLLEYLAAKAR